MEFGLSSSFAARDCLSYSNPPCKSIILEKASPTLPIPGAGRTFLSVSTITHDEDVQRTWTMHTLHAAEFDIARGRRSRDQGNGMRCPPCQPRDGFGNQSHYLLCAHDTQM